MRLELIKDPRADRPAKHVTMRQREVLQLLADGLTMDETAATLQITRRTVAFHKYSVMNAFNLNSSAELIRFAIREGIVKSA